MRNYFDEDEYEDKWERDIFGRRKSAGYTNTHNRNRVLGKWSDRYSTMSEAFFGNSFTTKKNPLGNVIGVAKNMLTMIGAKKYNNLGKERFILDETKRGAKSDIVLPVNLLRDKENSTDKNIKYDLSPEKTDAFLGATLEKASLKRYQTEAEHQNTIRDLDTRRGDFTAQGFIRGILNTERTSNKMAEIFPGYSRFISSSKNHQYKDNYEKVEFDPENPGPKLLDLATRMIRFPSTIEEEDIKEHAEAIKDFEKIFKRFGEELPETFEECDQLAKDIAKYIILKAEENDGNGEGGGENPEEGLNEAAKGLAKASGTAVDGEDLSEDAKNSLISDMGEAEKQAAEDEDSEKGIKYDDSKEDFDSEIKFIDVDDNKVSYDNILKNIDLCKASALRNLFKRKSRDQKFVMKSMKSGRFDTNKLAEAVQHVPTVYERIGEVKTDKICVGILIDESGSMHGSSIRMAQQAAVMLNEVFGKQPDVELFIYGHTADCNVRNETEIFVYREPGKNLRKFALGNVYAKGNNRDGHAILATAKRIRKKTTNSGILLVLSDGAPAAYNYDHGRRDTKEKVLKAEKLGFQVIQIAINNYVPSEEMFNHFVMMTDIESLPKDMLAYMSKKVNTLIKEHVSL